jgi:DNA-binding CsgD family transcriptional regulator
MHTATDAAWPALVGQIGRGGFGAVLLDVCQAMAGASAVSLLHWPDGGTPRLLDAASHQPDAARLAGQRYLARQHHRLDHQRRAPGLAPGQIAVRQQQAASLPSPGWREDCYATVGLASRLSLLLPGDGGCTVLNAYRPLDCPVGEPQALAALDRHAALLAATLRRHLDLAEVPPDPLAVLSARERQVVDAILAGHSAKQAGRALGLSPTSVATYRQRAFAKLGLRRQVELFGLLSRR